MAADNKMPGTAVEAGELPRSATANASTGHLDVSELLADRAAAPSPFGDDQTFPLPVESLRYTASTRPA